MKNRRSRSPKAGWGTSASIRLPRGLPVLYEDAAVVVVNKPAGLPSVPVEGLRVPSALSMLSSGLAAKKQRAFVVHRIDRFASGIVLFAKTAADQEMLIDQFLRHTPIREYQAVVRGVLARREDKLVHYLKRKRTYQTVSSKRDRGAARAALRYVVEKKLRDASLVRVSLETGLQNQIRVQFARIGHPVFGDRKYCPEESREKRIDRVALHATHLDFKHPRTKEVLSIDCPPPGDFQRLVQSLSKDGDSGRF